MVVVYYPEDDCAREGSPRTGQGPPRPPCNVRFVVGPDLDTWTISGPRSLLERAPHRFVQYMSDDGSTVRLCDVDKRGFEHYLRYLEGSEIKFTSVQTARTTLDVAIKFQCLDLVTKCVAYMDLELTANNVITVYKDLAKYCSNAHTSAPCAPALDTTPLSEIASAIQDRCSYLIHNCLLVIDLNADTILTKEEFDDLDFRDMSTIVNRETLQLKNEVVLFEALTRWSKCYCMKSHRQFSPLVMKEILGDLVFKVRFGLMTKNEFLNGPGAIGTFSENEKRQIVNVIENPKIELQGPMRYINKKRIQNVSKPKELSQRTSPEFVPRNRKSKEKKKSKDNSAWNCFLFWAFLFD